eukprot:scaffold2133_cov86-Cylindrotheca_fusiformis.AAC.1
MKFSLIISVLAASVGSTVGQTLFEAIGDATGNYSTLLGLVTSTGADDVIADVGGDVTIFGPNNDAFASVNTTGLNDTQIANILAGHVVQGKYNSSAVMTAGCVQLTTLSGTMIKVEYDEDHDHATGRDLQDGMVMVNGIHVVEADVEGTGGIFHGIDEVILEGSYSPCPSPGSGESDDSASSVVGASIAVIASVAAAAFAL